MILELSSCFIFVSWRNSANVLSMPPWACGELPRHTINETQYHHLEQQQQQQQTCKHIGNETLTSVTPVIYDGVPCMLCRLFTWASQQCWQLWAIIEAAASLSACTHTCPNSDRSADPARPRTRKKACAEFRCIDGEEHSCVLSASRHAGNF